MSHLLRIALFASAAIALGGCTIYVNKDAQDGRATNTASRPSKGKTTTAQAKPKPTTTTPTTKPTTPEPPRITGRNAFGNGSVGAFRGTAYVVPSDTSKVPDFSKLTPFATLFTDSFITQPQEFSGGFPGALLQDEWFAIKFEGNFEVAKDSNYTFRLVSDDGAVLYIDNEKVVDNDGVHTAKDATGSKTLKTGKHQLRLEYFQAKRGQVALALAMNAQGEAPKPLIGIR
ncbi:PA14 domain-containing protein [Polyangium aurulentum]|uniref:PA14 domain-containing protein n=1 Tax=Polyangium aurulentum TaxID=2567896 RepID=UPI0010AEDEFB|nr:PA14 domain-containing protein [Polyangium aurulentum]UQA55947.1 hypothetical protein E8A73_032075 [Polyangium aurulentum]